MLEFKYSSQINNLDEQTIPKALLQYLLIWFLCELVSSKSAYVYSSGINCVVIHIIQVDGKYSSMPVQKTTVTLYFDPDK